MKHHKRIIENLRILQYSEFRDNRKQTNKTSMSILISPQTTGLLYPTTKMTRSEKSEKNYGGRRRKRRGKRYLTWAKGWKGEDEENRAKTRRIGQKKGKSRARNASKCTCNNYDRLGSCFIKENNTAV